MLLALLLLSLFTLVLLGFYVFVAAPRSRTHQTFAAFIACLALWTVNDIVMWGFGGGPRLAGWWANASFALSLVLQFALVVFAWVFPENGEVPLRRAAVIFPPGAVLFPAALAGMMWDGLYFDGADFRIKLTPLAYVFGLYIYALFAYGFAVLFKKWRRYRASLWGKQLGAILWALIITAILKTVANIALPLAGVYQLLPVGARPVPPLPHRLQGRLLHRGGRRPELRALPNPDRLVELLRPHGGCLAALPRLQRRHGARAEPAARRARHPRHLAPAAASDRGRR